jgi:hypothetical protein
LADRELVGQAGGPVGAVAAVALDDTAGEADAVGEADAPGDAGEDAALDAVADEAPVVGAAVEAPPAGPAAEDDAPELHPATLIPTTAAAATAARRPADRVEPNIADLFPRPRHRSRGRS